MFMTALIPTTRLGNLREGLPTDLEVLNRPFGFYELLGLSPRASLEEIRRAYRQLAQRVHPDKGGSHEDFVALEQVVEILCDDGGVLGPEHSRRREYDYISSLDQYFSGGYLEKGKERTKVISEIFVQRLRLQRKIAKIEHDLSQRSPEFAQLKKELDAAASPPEKRRIRERLIEVYCREQGLDQQEAAQQHEKEQREYEQRQQNFLNSFRRSPASYQHKILDLLYLGEQLRFVPAGDYYRMQFGLVENQERGDVLELVLAGDCVLQGWKQVHCKAENAEIIIEDQNLTGLVQLVKGRITVTYQGMPYGQVIRARANTVRNIAGFVQKGNLFIPRKFAEARGWTERKPDLDLAVQEGEISLHLSTTEFAPSYSLESLIGGNFYKLYNSYNQKIISGKKYSLNNKK